MRFGLFVFLLAFSAFASNRITVKESRELKPFEWFSLSGTVVSIGRDGFCSISDSTGKLFAYGSEKDILPVKIGDTVTLVGAKKIQFNPPGMELMLLYRNDELLYKRYQFPQSGISDLTGVSSQYQKRKKERFLAQVALGTMFQVTGTALLIEYGSRGETEEIIDLTGIAQFFSGIILLVPGTTLLTTSFINLAKSHRSESSELIRNHKPNLAVAFDPLDEELLFSLRFQF